MNTLEEQRKLIQEAKQLQKIYSKVKTWNLDMRSKLFYTVHPLQAFHNNFTDGEFDVYQGLFDIIEQLDQVVPSVLFDKIYEGYILSILFAIDNYSYINHQITPGFSISDNGDRVAKCPYKIPKKFKKFEKLTEKYI